MATTVKTMTLEGKKYQLIPLAGAKAPAGVKTISIEGEEYILSPVEGPAPKTSETPKKNDGTKAEAKADVKSGTSSWLLPVLAVLVIIALIWFIVTNNSKKAIPATTGASVSAPALATQMPVSKDHNTWSAYGTPSFIVTDGTNTESASDVFTDASKGALTLTVKPTEETCLLQYGVTKIYTQEFSANFAANDTGAGFRVISKSYWNTLPVSDGAYNLCWKR